mmetsp:Transcript_50767/g.146442  ORF Transcript_50767/g.146442 Transcript_50767/m.146442 type:complete len:449 (+) Transcript_50767:107-1453(+)|eukprot:CAMPEP_0176054650 /NCGR_PEP_ID=MMETSP0120_2-20121206/27194_1 /TAXON_ID=160619 /ORGANISM="Kryptoperidinium foliaceum, Strain CCMP 1326" /LENGTH=448 /DNA_ID=CAMNT_0017388121 /DNA_START=30 /DNA_END=1376 /DNA_ORIENTATION=+
MGSYLERPVTTKESEVGSGHGLEWVSTGMQGWRVGMEDAHIALTGLQCGSSDRTKFSLFGVFDGHGGREVANFCRRHIPDQVQNHLRSLHKEDDQGLEVAAIAQALVRAFNGIDDMLRQPEFEEELLSYRKPRNSNGAENDRPTSPPRDPAGEGSQDGGAGVSGGQAQQSSCPSQVQAVQDRLQAAVAADMARANEKGSLTSQEAMRIAMGMSFLQRLEGSAAQGSSSPADSSTCALNAGCTAVCVVITDTYLVCANAGDSRAVLCRGGRSVALSRDHKPNDRSERRRIMAAGGTIKEITTSGRDGRSGRTQYRVNGDLNLSRAIGDLRHKTRPDLRPEQQVICATPDVHFEVREPDDEFLVLACDGVWDVRTNAQVCDEVREGLRAGRPLRDVTESLLDACISPDPKATQGLGADNMTIVVAKMEGVAAAPTSPRKGGFCFPFRCLR